MNKINPPLNFLPNIREEGYNKMTNKFPLIKGDVRRTGGFTLVELIVVITILAILGTIAFISLEGYSTQARDSVRITDISSIKTSLELTNLDSGKYPLPSNYTNINYSGSLVWNQGIFGENTKVNVDKLDKIPTDPVTGKEYTYSTTLNNFQYQIGGIMEGDDITIFKNSDKLNASEILVKAYVIGDYNGQLLKSLTGTTCNLLAVPSIISSDIDVNDLQVIIDNNYFVYRGFNNLPSSFKGSKFKHNGGFDFKPNNLIVYNDESNCEGIYYKSDYLPRIRLLKGLQDAYSGTILGDNNLLSLNINENNPSNNVINFAGNFVNNNLGGDVFVGDNYLSVQDPEITSTGNLTNTGSSYSCDSQPSLQYANFVTGNPTINNQSWQNTDSSLPCYYSCMNGTGWNGSDCVLASQCISGLSDITLSNGQIWSCKNLGASVVGLTSTSYGSYYQWGKNTSGWSSSYLSAGSNAWGAVTDNPEGTNRAARKGPCPTGWHVPSKNEWQSACLAITGTNCSNHSATIRDIFRNTLKLPFAGNKQYYNGVSDWVGTSGMYWSSSNYSANSAYDVLLSTRIFSGHYAPKAGGYSIRCLKN